MRKRLAVITARAVRQPSGNACCAVLRFCTVRVVKGGIFERICGALSGDLADGDRLVTTNLGLTFALRCSVPILNCIAPSATRRTTFSSGRPLPWHSPAIVVSWCKIGFPDLNGSGFPDVAPRLRYSDRKSHMVKEQWVSPENSVIRSCH
jgi:hypothetical protein